MKRKKSANQNFTALSYGMIQLPLNEAAMRPGTAPDDEKPVSGVARGHLEFRRQSR